MRFAANISRMEAHDSTIAAEVRKLEAIETQLRAIGQNAILVDPDAARLAQQALARIAQVKRSVARRRLLIQESADELQVMIAHERQEQRVLKQQLDRLGINE